jgi:hypothetical protein
MNTVQKAIAIFNLLPAIVIAIKAIEDAIPGAGRGKEKLAALREMLSAIDGAFDELWPQISSIVAVLVSTFNSVGTFKKADA